MKENYVKSLLYTYPNVQELLDQIDVLVEKKAISSMDNFKPCIDQCEEIIGLTEQKDILIEIYQTTKKILNEFSTYELDCLDYKYFKQKSKEYYKDFDAQSRQYFRVQNRIVARLTGLYESRGLTDEWFIKKCLNNTFFKEMLRRIEEQDNVWKNKFIGKGKTLKVKRVKNEEEFKSSKLSA